MIDWALRYIARGWPCFPVNGKKPRVKQWQKDATLSQEKARQWWEKWPQANIGLLCGLRFFVVDIDAHRGGEETWDALRSKHGALPDTLEQITGRGGRHIFYALAENFRVQNSEDFIGPGIDVRGHGGYVVAPPSVHPETHVVYQWDGAAELESQKIAAAPQWLLNVLRGQGAARKKSTTPAKIAQGARNDTLFREGCRLRRIGWQEEELFAALKILNTERCKPPLLERELRTIANSAAKYTPAAIAENAPPATSPVTTMQASGAAVVESTDDDWTIELIRSGKGKRAPVVQNALIALRKAPEWRGVLGFDESALRIMILKPPPWEEQRKLPFQWSDEDDVRTAAWLQTNHILATPLTARQAIATVASEHRYHPIRSFLDGLAWDGDRRVHNWLANYLGVKPSEYVTAVGSRWLIGAVARIYQPGCKNDCCLILEGKQGTLKSTALRTLGEPWFTDDMPELGTKDSQIQTRGIWIIELSELDSMQRGEVSRVKAYMSRATDRFRPPYGRAPIDAPRECVFAGTSNKGAYLRDETGGRRFWPVQCGGIDIPWLRQDRDQLFAEAVVLYRDGTPWWLDTEKLTNAALEEQEDRYDCDPWDELIGPWVRGRTSVSVGEVLDGCLNKIAAQWTQQDLNRVARSLIAMRWERFKAGPRSAREWRYRLRQAD